MKPEPIENNIPKIIEVVAWWNQNRNGRQVTLTQAAYFFNHKTTKIGRNAPCSCGSGKKFKKCCGEVKLMLQLNHLIKRNQIC